MVGVMNRFHDMMCWPLHVLGAYDMRHAYTIMCEQVLLLLRALTQPTCPGRRPSINTRLALVLPAAAAAVAAGQVPQRHHQAL